MSKEGMRVMEKAGAENEGKGEKNDRDFQLIRGKGYARKRFRFSPKRKVLYEKRR
jgi:hypothetical protein